MSQHLAKNTAFMTLASSGQKIVAFVYFLFLARVMMPEKTGQFFLATSIVMLFSVFSDMGLSSLVIREISKRPEEREKIVRTAIGMKGVLTILTVIILFLFVPFFHYSAEITGLIFLASFVVIADAFALIFYGILRASQRLHYEAIGMFVGQCVTVFVGSVSLIVYPDVRFLIFALICGSATTCLVALFRVVHLYGWNLLVPSWNKKDQWNIVKIILPFALAGIFTKIYSTIDVILISKMMNTMAVGVYSVAYKFTYAFQFLPLAFAAALYPSLSATVEQDKIGTANTFAQSIWYCFLMATPIVFGVWLLAPELIAFTGNAYSESVTVLRMLIFILFPAFLEIPFGAFLNASNRQVTRMKIMGFALVVNTFISIVFIPELGLLGAVIGSLVSYTLMIVIEFVIGSKILPQFLTRTFIRRMSGTLYSGVIMLGAGFLLKMWMHWVLVIFCAASVYFGMLLLTRSVTKADVVRLFTLFQKNPVV